MKVWLRLSDAKKPQLPGINYIGDRFDKGLIEKYELAGNLTSMIYICGPPQMCTTLAEAMKELQVDKSVYFFV